MNREADWGREHFTRGRERVKESVNRRRSRRSGRVF